MQHDSFDVTMDDGAEIVVRHHAKPGATRLYISHGNGFAVDGYRVFWEPLIADFDVVLFDMRNHGQNVTTGADGHHYQQMARDPAETWSLSSRTTQATPLVARSMAAARPMGPAPTMITVCRGSGAVSPGGGM